MTRGNYKKRVGNVFPDTPSGRDYGRVLRTLRGCCQPNWAIAHSFAQRCKLGIIDGQRTGRCLQRANDLNSLARCTELDKPLDTRIVLQKQSIKEL